MRNFFKRFVMMVIVIVTLSGCGFLFDVLGDDDEEKQEKIDPPVAYETIKQKTKNYLEKTYNENFEVNEPIYNPEFGFYSIAAIPNGKEKLAFGITVQKNDKQNKIKYFKDDYLRARWSSAYKEEIKTIVTELYPNQKYEAILNALIKDEHLSKAKQMGLMKARKKYPFEIGHYLEITLDRAYKPENRMEEFQKAYKLVQFLKEKHMKRVNISINYTNERVIWFGAQESAALKNINSWKDVEKAFNDYSEIDY